MVRARPARELTSPLGDGLAHVSISPAIAAALNGGSRMRELAGRAERDQWR